MQNSSSKETGIPASEKRENEARWRSPGLMLACLLVCIPILWWMLAAWLKAPHRPVTWTLFSYAIYAGAGVGIVVILCFEIAMPSHAIRRLVRLPLALSGLVTICALVTALTVVVPLSVAFWCIENTSDWWPSDTGGSSGVIVYTRAPPVCATLHILYAVGPPLALFYFIPMLGLYPVKLILSIFYPPLSTVAARSSKSAKEDFSATCPVCNRTTTVRTRTKKGSRKLVRCNACNGYFRMVAVDDGRFDLAQVPMFEFVDSCPICKSSVTGQIPDYPGSTLAVSCGRCEIHLIASRSSAGVNLRVPKGEQRKLPRSLYDAVFSRLPARPWPTYVHKAIAKELGVSNSVVSQIIGTIIEAGHFPLPAQSDAKTMERSAAEPRDAGERG